MPILTFNYSQNYYTSIINKLVYQLNKKVFFHLYEWILILFKIMHAKKLYLWFWCFVMFFCSHYPVKPCQEDILIPTYHCPEDRLDVLISDVLAINILWDQKTCYNLNAKSIFKVFFLIFFSSFIGFYSLYKSTNCYV